MSRRWVALVALVGACRSAEESAPGHDVPRDAAVAPTPADAGPPRLDEAALTARFDELRDARGLRCLIDRQGHMVMEALDDTTPGVIVRIAALASVEVAQRDGETPTLEALMWALHYLIVAGDRVGMKQVFELADQVPMAPTWFGGEGPYRALVGLPMRSEDVAADRLEVIRETAIGGDVDAATRMYDHELLAEDSDEPYELGPHVGALIAIGRPDAARAVIAAAPPAARPDLAASWLDVAVRLAKGVDVAAEALLAEIVAFDPAARVSILIGDPIRAAARAGFAAEVAPVRVALAVRTPADTTAALLLADHRDLPAAPVGTLDDALASALAKPDHDWDLARVWARHVAEGATPAFEAKLAAAACSEDAFVAGAPAPATAGATLVAREAHPRGLAPCDGSELALSLRRGAEILDTDTVEGACEQVCTDADQRAGERELRRLEKQVARGALDEGALDSNLTECLFVGPHDVRVSHVGDRDVALFADHWIGAHDIDTDRYQLAVEVCGAIFVSSAFAERYAGAFAMDELSVAAAPDGRELRVEVSRDGWRGVVYRLTLPTSCPGAPDEVVRSAE